MPHPSVVVLDTDELQYALERYTQLGIQYFDVGVMMEIDKPSYLLTHEFLKVIKSLSQSNVVLKQAGSKSISIEKVSGEIVATLDLKF